MFAVLKTGGKQYKVSKNDVIAVEKLSAEAGDIVQFNKVLMLDSDPVQIGTPEIEGAAVNAEIISQIKSKKVISFVKRRRKNSSKRTKGHRQNITILRIKEILTSGHRPTGKAIETGVSVISFASKNSSSNPKKVVSKTKSASETDKNKKSSTLGAPKNLTKKVVSKQAKPPAKSDEKLTKKEVKETKTTVSKSTETKSKVIKGTSKPRSSQKAEVVPKQARKKASKDNKGS